MTRGGASVFEPGKRFCCRVAALGRKSWTIVLSPHYDFPANGIVVGARPAGLEPATCGLEVRCSVQLSYGRIGLGMRISPRQGSAKIPDGSNAAAVRSSEWLLDVPETLAMPGIVAHAWRRSWDAETEASALLQSPRVNEDIEHPAGSRSPPRPKVWRRSSLGPCRNPSPPEGPPAPRFPPLLL